MTTQIFLIAPAATDARLPNLLALMLEIVPVSALLLPRGQQAENAYKSLIKLIVPLAQADNCAVLVEGDPGLVKLLGADGLHSASAGLESAIAALKPHLIVGTSATTRDEAMSGGESGADYVMFGPLSGAIDPATRQLAGWWAETMQVPSILSDPAATPETLNAEGCEFFAMGDSIWTAPDPIASFKALTAALGRQP